jgi:hypothetical protein
MAGLGLTSSLAPAAKAPGHFFVRGPYRNLLQKRNRQVVENAWVGLACDQTDRGNASCRATR